MNTDVLITFLSGGLGVAIFQGIFKLIEWKLNRKAKLEDRDHEEKIKGIPDELKEIKESSKENYERLSDSISTLRSDLSDLKAAHQEDRDKFSESIHRTEEQYKKLSETYHKGHNELIQSISDTNANLSLHVSESESLQENIIKSNKLIMREKIRRLALDALERKYIYVDEHELLHAMWVEYHDAWKGNGDLNIYITKVDKLPIKENHD